MANRLKQRSDGRYKAKYKDRQFYGKTQAEALRLRDEYKYRCEHGIDDIRKKTVGEFASEWLPSAKGSVGKKCYNDYCKQLDKLIDACGDMQLNAVTPMDIKNIWAGFIGMSDSTIHRANMLYKAMFASAIENGYCRHNPVISESAKPHKGTKGTHRAITDEERKLILETPHRVQLPAMIMLYAGLRRGEVLALSSSDIVKGNIIVSKAIRYDGNKPIIDVPKTENSLRKVPVLDVLKPYLKNVNGLIFPSANGELCSETAFQRAWQSYIKALSKKAGYQVDIRPHDLRHSYCEWAITNGVSVKTMMQLLGHADEKMILQIYDHVTSDRLKNEINMLNGVQTGFKNKKKKPTTVDK